MFNFPPPGGPPPHSHAASVGSLDPEGNTGTNNHPPASRNNNGPPPAFRASPGAFRAPPVAAVAPSRSYSADSHYDDDYDDDDGDGALGATINLVSNAASMFFRAAAPPPPQQQQQLPPPVAQGSPMATSSRNPPPPIDPSSSMLESSYSWDSQQQQQQRSFAPPPIQTQPSVVPPTTVPSSPLARSSPRVVIPPNSPITTAAVAQIPVPTLSQFVPPPSKESPAGATTAAVPMMPTLASTAAGGTPSPRAAGAPAAHTFLPPPPPQATASRPPTATTTANKPPPRAFATPPPSPQVHSVAAPPSPATPLRSNHHSNSNSNSGSSNNNNNNNIAMTPTASLRTPLPTPSSTSTSRFSLPTPSSSRRPLRAPPARAAASPRATPGRTKFKLPPPRKPRTPLATTATTATTAAAAVKKEKEEEPEPVKEESKPAPVPAPVAAPAPVPAEPVAPVVEPEQPPVVTNASTTTEEVVKDVVEPEPEPTPIVEQPVEVPTPKVQEVVATPEPVTAPAPATTTTDAVDVVEPHPAPTTESSLALGWVEVVDPTSGQTYYYNETTQETSWERPVTVQETIAPAAEFAAVQEVPVTEKTTTPELTVETSEPALEDVSPVPETTAADTTATPSLAPGWMEVVEPRSGQMYYYNETSQETSWQRPTMPATAIVTEASPELATEPATTMEDDNHDEPLEEPTSEPEESAPELAVEETPVPSEDVAPLVPETTDSATPTMLAPGWTQVVDPTSGQTYYYNEMTQETSWEPPMVPTSSSDEPVEPLAAEKEEEMPTEAESTPELAMEEPEKESEQVEDAPAPVSTLAPGWEAVEDPTSGQTYYYNETTQETSWEPPLALTTEPAVESIPAEEESPIEETPAVGEPDVMEDVAVDDVDEVAPMEDEADNEPSPEPEVDATIPESAAGSTLIAGWVEVVDPSSGQTYYYNEETQETSWEPPVAPVAEEPVEEVTQEDENVDVHDDAEPEVAEENPEVAQIDEQPEEPVEEPEMDGAAPGTALLPGWVEVVDPSSGQTYYYNEETQETSWEPPMAPASEEPLDVVEDLAVDGTDEPEVTDELEETPEVAESNEDVTDPEEEPEVDAAVPDSTLLPGWVEVVDPTSGQVYYYNEDTQETSWEAPMAPSNAAVDEVSDGAEDMGAHDADLDEPEVADELEETPEEVEESGGAEESEIDADAPDGTLLPGWVEVVDPSSGQTYYYNEETQETSWEPPVATPTTDLDTEPVMDASEEADMNVNEPEEELPSNVEDTPEVARDEPEPDDEAAAPESTSSLAPGWVEIVDPTTGQTYYYNESTQETSWEPPEQTLTETADETDEPEDEQIDEVEGEPIDEGTPEVAVDDEDDEPESASDVPTSEWEEVVDPTTGQTYYYNSLTQETSWELPVEAPKEDSPLEATPMSRLTAEEGYEEDPAAEFVADTGDDLHENDDLASEPQDKADTLEPETSLPAGWTEVIDPSSGQVYFYNEVTQETSWEKPTVDEVEDKTDSHEEDIPTSEFSPEDDDVIDEEPKEDTAGDSNPEGAVEANGDLALAPGWTEVVDPTSGDTYYYNEETQETSWEPPLMPAEVVDGSPSEQEEETAETDQVDIPETALETDETSQDPETETPESVEVAGWTEITDPTSGQTYYYNEATQETSWDPPVGFIGEGETKLESEDQHEEFPEEERLDGVTESDSGLDNPEQGDIAPGWTEVVDPTSGQTYYFNETTQETSWEPPMVPHEGSGPAQDEIPLDEGEPEDGDANNEEVASDVAEEVERTLEQQEVNEIKLAPGWVEVVDQSTGQTYYYNELTEETSWEVPDVAEGVNMQAINSDEHEVTDELNEDPTVAVEYNGHVTEPVEAPVEDAAVRDDALLPGWTQVVDPSSGQTYYYNEDTQETSWEPPAAPTAEAVEEPIPGEDNRDEPETVDDVDETPDLGDGHIGMEEPDIDADAPDGALLPGWVEVVDPTSGQTYYYNEETQETSWEPPTGLPSTDDGVDPALDSANEPEEDFLSNVAEASEAEDESEQAFDVAAPERPSTLAQGWVEIVDPSTGQTYYYNESTQETSWEFPSEAPVREDSAVASSQVAEAPSTIELLKEQEAAKIDDVFASLNEEFQVDGVGNESEANVDAEPEDDADAQSLSVRNDDPASGEVDPELVVLPEFWTQAVDPDTGKTYYFNTLTQDTSWKPPEGSVVPSQEKTDPQELPTSGPDDTHEPLAFREEETNDQDTTEENSSVHEESERLGEVESKYENEDFPSQHFEGGWTKTVDPQTGGEYYFNPETGETSWEVPAAAQSNPETEDQVDSNGIDEPDDLPSGWVIMIDDQSGETYYYNEITQETSWDRPIESQKRNSSDLRTDEKHPASNMEHDLSSNQEKASEEISLDTTGEPGEDVTGIQNAPMEDVITEAPLPEGWVEVVDPDSGTIYYFNEVSNETTWDRPTEDNIDDTDANGDDVISSDLPDGWTEVIDEDSGKVYYLNERENTTTWERPATTEAAQEGSSPSDGQGASNEISLSDGWVEIVDPQSGDTYYLNTETNETSWEPPSGGKDGTTTDANPNKDVGHLDDWVDVARNEEANDQPLDGGGFLTGILSDAESQGAIRTKSELIRDVIQSMNESRAAKSIMGPFASSPDAQVLAYISNKASSSNEGILWKLIAIAAESRGRLRSDEGVFSPNSPESAIVKLLLDDSDSRDSAQIDDVHPTSTSIIDKEKAATELQQLLLAGKRKEAVEAAIKCQDFATALLVGTMCDSETYKMATAAFAANAFASGSPMQTVAMLFAGSLQDPGFVGAGSAHWSADGAELKQNWKKHLAGVISNRVAGWDEIVLSLGDRLRDIGEVEGAHFCYMVCGCPVSSPCMEGTRIALLGCEHKSCEDQLLATKESLEAFERTEAYEWAKRQGNKNAVLRSFFPLKLIFAAHLIDCGLESVATSHVKCVRDFLRHHTSQSGTNNVTLTSLFDDEKSLSFVLEELEKRLGCYEEPITGSEDASVVKGPTVTSKTKPLNKPTSQNEIPTNDQSLEPSFRFDQPNPMDSTFVSAKSNLLDVTGYSLDSPLKPDNLSPQTSFPPKDAPPSLKAVYESKSDKQASAKPKQLAPPSPSPPVTTEHKKLEEKRAPVAMMTPQASSKQKPRAAPSTAPSVLMGKKASEKSGSQSAPSSAGKKGGWSLRQRLVKWINPDATEVVLPENEEKPYYDEKRKVWVFPGDNPDELVKPVAPPPTAMQKSTEPAPPEPETSNDPLAAMMAPPRRGPTTLQRPGRASTPRTPGTPAGMPMPSMAGAASPMPGGAPPKFAVFKPVPKPTGEEQQES